METPRPRLTLLYVTDEPSASETLERKLRLADYDSVVTSSSVQAVAFLFVNRRINAVVLDQQTRERPSLALARTLHSVRADVPILLLSPGLLEPLPACLDACVQADRDFASLVPILNTLLTERWHGGRLVLQH